MVRWGTPDYVGGQQPGVPAVTGIRWDVETTIYALATAPPAWWRPPLDITRLLDLLAGLARPPVGIIAPDPTLLLPALIRLPSATVIAIPSGNAATSGQLAMIGAFIGAEPRMTTLSAVSPGSFRTVLWLDLHRPPTLVALRQVDRCLDGTGLLAMAIQSAGIAVPTLTTLRLRRTLQHAGLRIIWTCGFLGPRALVWSAVARLALTAGRLDRYDRYHAAMRAAYAERWPGALLCRTVVVLARGT